MGARVAFMNTIEETANAILSHDATSPLANGPPRIMTCANNIYMKISGLRIRTYIYN